MAPHLTRGKAATEISIVICQGAVVAATKRLCVGYERQCRGRVVPIIRIIVESRRSERRSIVVVRREWIQFLLIHVLHTLLSTSLISLGGSQTILEAMEYKMGKKHLLSAIFRL